MDWVLKASSAWDLPEFTRDQFTVLSDGSSIPENRSKECFSVDLGFDIIGDGNISKFKEPKDLAKESPRGLSKKAKLQNTSCQNVSCLVDGCKSDLSGCREYHRRHRVCEGHSKTPVVLICGKEQRFCQQCSRFHSLSEFDEVKRSCRKRLDGHNRRRRKPRPDSLYLNCGSILANNQGTKILHFGAPQACTTGFGSLSWPNEDKHHQKPREIVQQKNDANSYARDHSKREKKFPFLLVPDPYTGNQALPKVSSSQQAIHVDLTGKDEVLTPLVESKRALSLLSTHKTQTPGSTPSHLMQQDVLIHLNQPTDSCLQFDSLVKHLESQPLSTVLAPTIFREGSHFNGMIHFRPERLLENESSQLVSFSWS